MVPTVVLYQLQQSVVSLYCNIGLLTIYPYYSLEMQFIAVFLPRIAIRAFRTFRI